MTFNLLITSAGGYWAKNLFSLIKKKTIYKSLRVHAVNKKKIKNIKKYLDSFYIVPNPKNKNYIKKILNIVKKESINLIIPGSDEEAEALAKEKKKIKSLGSDLACVNYKDLKCFKDKLSVYKKLDKFKIRKAIWKKANNFKQLYKIISEFLKKDLEIVIKPNFSRGGRDVTVIRKKLTKKVSYNFGREVHVSINHFLRNEYKKYKKRFPVIIMERLYEPSYDVDLLSWKGKIIKYVSRRRIGSQGINGNIIQKNNKVFFNYTKKIAKIFNLSWLYDCDIMLDRFSKPVLIELNPRISGSLYASLAANINLIDDLISICNNNFKFINKSRINKKVIIKQKKLN